MSLWTKWQHLMKCRWLAKQKSNGKHFQVHVSAEEHWRSCSGGWLSRGAMVQLCRLMAKQKNDGKSR